jgi:UDP-GlcNAc:undecaprenyl-phosphate GlcNAc-1-phosphate transferase
MNYASNTAIILLIISTGFGIELFIELIGLVGENRQPLMCALKFLGNRRFRQKVLMARAEKRQDKQEEESEDLASSASQIKEKRRKRKHYQAKHKK